MQFWSVWVYEYDGKGTKMLLFSRENNVDFRSKIKKIQWLDHWPWNDLSSEFLLASKETLSVGSYIWDMMEKGPQSFCSVEEIMFILGPKSNDLTLTLTFDLEWTFLLNFYWLAKRPCLLVPIYEIWWKSTTILLFNRGNNVDFRSKIKKIQDLTFDLLTFRWPWNPTTLQNYQYFIAVTIYKSRLQLMKFLRNYGTINVFFSHISLNNIKCDLDLWPWNDLDMTLM